MNNQEICVASVSNSMYWAYYPHKFYCSNCNKTNHRYILKGHQTTEPMIECENCGCQIQAGEPKVITACGSDGIARDHTIAKGGDK